MAPMTLDQLTDGNMIDRANFNQILEMDEDDDREFSRSIVFDFFDQAEETFEAMDTALKDEKFEELSQLGHFLKGSSATLGLTQVRDSCEKIQNYGAHKDASGQNEVTDEDVLLEQLSITIKAAKVEFKEVEERLRLFYNE